MRKLYLSFAGPIISFILNILANFHKPFMVYGYFNRKKGVFRKHTRISASAKLVNRKNLDIADHVWIGHYVLIDCIGGVAIGEGVNISSHTAIYSHSSHDSIRLLGRKYILTEARQRPGYKLDSVTIGAYSFIGTSSIILPGVNIGIGCIIGAGSLVNCDIPDYAIAVGNPVKIIGDTRDRDKKLYREYLNKDQYYLNNL